MGTLGKDGSNPLIFDGRPESWPPFKKALHQLLDKEGYGWVVEGGDVFCAMLQAASAKAAKSTSSSLLQSAHTSWCWFSPYAAERSSPPLQKPCRASERERGREEEDDDVFYLIFVLAESKISPKLYTPRVLPTIRDC